MCRIASRSIIMCRFWTQFLCEKKALQASHHQAKKKEKFFLSRKLQTKQLEEKKTAAYIIDIYCVEREAHFRGSHVTGVYKLDRKYHAHAKNKRSKNRNKNMQTSLKLLTAVYRVNTISFFPPNNRKSRTAKSTSLHQSRNLPHINTKKNKYYWAQCAKEIECNCKQNKAENQIDYIFCPPKNSHKRSQFSL